MTRRLKEKGKVGPAKTVATVPFATALPETLYLGIVVKTKKHATLHLAKNEPS